MIENISQDEQAREDHRAHIMRFTGFTFTVLLALILLDSTKEINLCFSIYYIFVSFILFLFSYNLQGYKDKRWHDYVGTASAETATLCLILTVLSLLLSSNLPQLLIIVLTFLSLLIWIIDHFLRINFSYNFLKEVKNVRSKKG